MKGLIYLIQVDIKTRYNVISKWYTLRHRVYNEYNIILIT